MEGKNWNILKIKLKGTKTTSTTSNDFFTTFNKTL